MQFLKIRLKIKKEKKTIVSFFSMIFKIEGILYMVNGNMHVVNHTIATQFEFWSLCQKTIYFYLFLIVIVALHPR